jgi:hypothetical protein
VGDGVAGLSFERHVATNAYPYGAFAYGRGANFPGGIRADSEGDETTGRFSLEVPQVAGFRVRARADASATGIGVPGELNFLTPTASQHTSTNSFLVEVERDGGASSLTVSLAASDTRLAYVDPVGNFGESDVATGRSQLSVRDAFAARGFDLVTGVDFARESGAFSIPQTPNFVSPSASPIPAFGLGAAQAQAAAYVRAGVSPFAGARFTAGLRAENDSPRGSVLAPSLGGTLRSGALRFSADVGESFNVPTLEQLYYPGYSNPKLLPEKAQTADATVAFDVRGGTLSAGWFDRNGSNFIVDDPVTFVPFNAGRAQVAGLVMTASTKPVAGLVVQASLTNLYRALDVSTGARLPENPVMQAALTLARPFRDGSPFSYGLRWGIVGSDGGDRANLTSLSGEYDAYDRLDAFVRYKLSPVTVLGVRGSNLGNETYAPIFGYPAPGRGVQVELSTR